MSLTTKVKTEDTFVKPALVMHPYMSRVYAMSGNCQPYVAPWYYFSVRTSSPSLVTWLVSWTVHILARLLQTPHLDEQCDLLVPQLQ